MNAVEEVRNELVAAKERWITQIDTALKTLEIVSNLTPAVAEPVKIKSFAGMGIVESAISYLRTVKEKKGTQEILAALAASEVRTAKGRVPDYNTVYTLLRRRQEKVGDIKSTKGKWDLVTDKLALAS